MTRHWTFLVFIFSGFFMTGQTAPQQLFPEDTYFMAFLPKVERLCGLDSSVRASDGFEFYFTKKGNLIYKNYWPNEGEAWFYFGTYFLTDTGISYTITNRYYVKIKYKYLFEMVGNAYVDKRVDITDYNKGKLKTQKPSNKFIHNNDCKEFPYATNPMNYSKRVTIVINTPGTIPPGSVFEANEGQKEILARKIKSIKIFRDL